VPSIAIDLPGHGASTDPLTDLYGDAAHVVQVIESLAAQGHTSIVLVGHSYGGAVITEAASSTTTVEHLVYLTAFCLDQGESVLGLLGSLPPQTVALSGGFSVGDDGNARLTAGVPRPAFYGRCEPLVADAAEARLGPQPIATFTQLVTGSPRRSIDSTYVVCAQDQAIHPSHQATMAQRCPAVLHLDTDHSPFASLPVETADILEAISRRTVA
jgi:pimeloyl-ACP methyl ester carboxylesterase